MSPSRIGNAGSRDGRQIVTAISQDHARFMKSLEVEENIPIISMDCGTLQISSKLSI
jgi:hypothetical protein